MSSRVSQALDADDALADRGQHVLRREPRADPRLEPEALEPGGREHGRVAVAGVELGEARVDVAAQHDDLEVGPAMTQLALAAQARGADARALRQGSQRFVARRDEGIARIAALERGGDREAGGQVGGHVLHRMDGDVGAPVLERVFELLDEQSLAAGRRRGCGPGCGRPPSRSGPG